MNYPPLPRLLDEVAPNQSNTNARAVEGLERSPNSSNYGLGESSSNAIQLIIGFICNLPKTVDERNANSMLTERQLDAKNQKEGDELLKVAFWQIVYPLIRIGICAFILWIVYLLVQGAGELVAHISWDMLGIGLALFLPVAYMIAVARREKYGDGGGPQ